MPKSKRSKLISLTQVKAKNRPGKENLLNKLLTHIKKFSRVAVVSHSNLNSQAQVALRRNLGSLSQVVFGKKRIIKLALQQYSESKPEHEDMNLLCDFLKGPSVAIIFSNLQSSVLDEKLKKFSQIEYAQPGHPSPANIVLTKGDAVFTSLSTSNDTHLKKLGLDVLVQNGKLFLESDFLAAKKGEELNSQQCKILKLLGIKVGKVSVDLLAVYNKESNSLQKFI